MLGFHRDNGEMIGGMLLALGIERGSVSINKANNNNEPLISRCKNTSIVQPNQMFLTSKKAIANPKN